MSDQKRKRKKIEYTKSSGNVFADVGVPNPEEALAKAQIVMKIHDIIKKKKLTQTQAAKILKITQPKISLLLRGDLSDFSLERLLRFLNDLGQDVYITVTPCTHNHGTTWIYESPTKAKIAALAR